MAVTKNKIVAFGKLVKDANGELWFYDLNRSGLYFKLTMLHRKSGEDEGGFNERVNAAYDALQVIDANSGDEVVYKPTIGLVPTQASGLSPKWRAIFAEKAYFFLYDDTQTSLGVGKDMPGYGEMYADFVWLNDDRVATWMSPDRLAYQYPRTLAITVATSGTGGDSDDDGSDDDSEEEDAEEESSDDGSSSGTTDITAVFSNAKINLNLSGNFMGNPFDIYGTVTIEPIEDES